MTPLQTAAQLALKTLESGELLCELTAASMLRVALSDEQAQAVEPVAWLVRWRPAKHEPRDINPWVALSIAEYRSNPSREERPLFAHPAPPAQQVAVPESMVVSTAPSYEFANGWNAYRSAMLTAQGAKP